jgi:UDP-N-acetylmuramoylalanine-D-glutamate ligase
VAKAIKISDKIINQAVKDFKGLPYRLEKITEKK